MTSQATDFVIERALIDTLRVKPFEKITIDDIARTAEIDRSTFYRYFHNKYEALSSSMRVIITPDMFKELDSMNPSSRLATMIQWVVHNHKLMKNLLVENQQFSSYQELVRVVTTILLELDNNTPNPASNRPLANLIHGAPDPKRLIHFAAAMIVSVLTDYIANDDKIKADDVINDIHYLFVKLGLDEDIAANQASTMRKD